MKSPGERSSGWPLVAGIVLGTLALTARPAFASLNVSATGISGGSGIGVDATGTVSIGASTATGITIGNPNSIITISGPITITPTSTIGVQLANPTSLPILTATTSFNGTLPSNTTYYFECAASDGIGATLPTAEASGTTLGVATSGIKVACPSITDATAYNLYFATSSGSETSYFQSGSNIINFATTTAAIVGSPSTIDNAYSVVLNRNGNSYFGGNVVLGNPRGTLTISGLSSTSTQCLHVNASGTVSGTGSDCGSGGASQWMATSTGIYYNATGSVAIGTTMLASGCPAVVGPNTICLKAPPYFASGSSATTTLSGAAPVGTTTITVANAATFAVGQGIAIVGAGPTASVTGTITYSSVSGGTLSGTALCLATASNGGGQGATASVQLTNSTLSGNLTLYTSGWGYTSVPTTWTLSQYVPTGGSNLIPLPGTVSIACSGTMTTSGGSLAATYYTGTITGIAGNAITLNTPTLTAVSAGVVVLHDETSALNAAIAAIATSSAVSAGTAEGTIIVPDGTYNFNGPIIDPSGVAAFGSPSIISLPSITLSYANPVVINIVGSSVPQTPAGTATIFQTASTQGGSLIGGWASQYMYGPTTNVALSLTNLLFRAPPNPGIKMVNAYNLEAFTAPGSLVFDTGISSYCGNLGAGCFTVTPTNPLGAGLIMPSYVNVGQAYAANAYQYGYFVGLQVSDHSVLDDEYCENAQYCLVSIAPSHGAYIGRLLTQHTAVGMISSYPYGITSIISIGQWAAEENTILIQDTNTAGDCGYSDGIINFQDNQPPVIIGGCDLKLQDLQSPASSGAFGNFNWVPGGILAAGQIPNQRSYGGTLTNQTITFAPTPNNSSTQAFTAIVYPMFGHRVSVRVPVVVTGSSTASQQAFILSPFALPPSSAYVSMRYDASGVLSCILNGTVLGSALYNAASQACWSIREDNGSPNKIYCDVSPDGVTWSNNWPTTGVAYTSGNPTPYSNSETISVSAGGTGVTTPGTAQFSNFTYDNNGHGSVASAQSGDTGTAACTSYTTMPKTVQCYLSGYTCLLGGSGCTVAQTFTYVLPFSTAPVVLMNSASSTGSCGTYNPSVTATSITFPANAGMSAETCSVVLTGP